jgi:hypothetical protein
VRENLASGRPVRAKTAILPGSLVSVNSPGGKFYTPWGNTARNAKWWCACRANGLLCHSPRGLGSCQPSHGRMPCRNPLPWAKRSPRGLGSYKPGLPGERFPRPFWRQARTWLAGTLREKIAPPQIEQVTVFP